jgi:hypothetical protein
MKTASAPTVIGLFFLVGFLLNACAFRTVETEQPLSPEEVVALIHAHDFSSETTARLQRISVARTSQADERNTARVLLAESWMRAHSPVGSSQLREHLRRIISDATDTWHAQVAHLQLIRSYNVHTENSEMLAAINDAISANRFDLLNSPQDPLLQHYITALYRDIPDKREILIYMRGACLATTLEAHNLAAARIDYNALSADNPLKKQLRNQLRNAEAMTIEQRQRMRQVLIETVRRAEEQEAERKSAIK